MFMAGSVLAAPQEQRRNVFFTSPTHDKAASKKAPPDAAEQIHSHDSPADLANSDLPAVLACRAWLLRSS
jgi:hypothetical protein